MIDLPERFFLFQAEPERQRGIFNAAKVRHDLTVPEIRNADRPVRPDQQRKHVPVPDAAQAPWTDRRPGDFVLAPDQLFRQDLAFNIIIQAVVLIIVFFRQM